MKQRLAWFLAGSVAFWAAATGMACGLRDEGAAAAVYITVAAGLCLIPSLATFVWAMWSTAQAPEEQLTAVLGGTAVRLFVVLAVGFLLTLTVPYFTQRYQSFWLWVLVFYLFDLGLEMTILLRGRRV